MTKELEEWFTNWDAVNCRADNAQFTVGHVAREYAKKAVEAAFATGLTFLSGRRTGFGTADCDSKRLDS